MTRDDLLPEGHPLRRRKDGPVQRGPLSMGNEPMVSETRTITGLSTDRHKVWFVPDGAPPPNDHGTQSHKESDRWPDRREPLTLRAFLVKGALYLLAAFGLSAIIRATLYALGM